MFYISTRYPNGIDGDLVLTEFYEREDAERYISSAELILNIAKRYLKS